MSIDPLELHGGAHAGSYTIALSLNPGEAHCTAEHMETRVAVTLDKVAVRYSMELRGSPTQCQYSRRLETIGRGRARFP